MLFSSRLRMLCGVSFCQLLLASQPLEAAHVTCSPYLLALVAWVLSIPLICRRYTILHHCVSVRRLYNSFLSKAVTFSLH